MIVLFTDGACSGNPGPGGWACIILKDHKDVLELGGFTDKTTNNRMEMTAIIKGLKHVSSSTDEILICTDSQYVIDGYTKWLHSWKRKGWITASGSEVKNRDLWEELDQLILKRTHNRVAWKWVRGHNDHDANERCDEIAVAYSQNQPIELYSGERAQYPYGQLNVIDESKLQNRIDDSQQPNKSKTEKGWYISLIDGKFQRHQYWHECQALVKGRHARFKKVKSKIQEDEVLRLWGVL